MSEETDTVQPMVSAPSSDSQKGPSRTTVQSSFASYFISGTSPYLNILLVFTVLNPILYYVDESTNLVFISGVISITILADRIRFILQQIDEIVPAWLNNVLDTLFNNSPEFCLAFYALDRNQEALVKYFLLGQIMSNLSLVLGVSFMVGGFFRDVNKFHTKILNSSSIILFVGLTPMLFSTIQGVSYELTSTAGKNEVARGTSFIMLSTYIMYLVFQVHCLCLFQVFAFTPLFFHRALHILTILPVNPLPKKLLLRQLRSRRPVLVEMLLGMKLFPHLKHKVTITTHIRSKKWKSTVPW